MATQDAPTVRVEDHGEVALVIMARPERLNALDAATMAALHRALVDRLEDPDVGAVVLTGEGRAFSAGGDVKAMREAREAGKLPELLTELTNHHHPMVQAILTSGTPVVTAVNGVAAGGGLGLALAGDVRLAAESAVFQSAYPRLGASPDGGATYLLPRLVGVGRAQRMLLLNERVDAGTAERWGLVHRVVRDTWLRREALQVAQELAGGPREALARTKRLLRESMDAGLAAHLDAEQAGIVASSRHPDFAEGLQSLAEHREPDFRRKGEGGA